MRSRTLCHAAAWTSQFCLLMRSRCSLDGCGQSRHTLIEWWETVRYKCPRHVPSNRTVPFAAEDVRDDVFRMISLRLASRVHCCRSKTGEISVQLPKRFPSSKNEVLEPSPQQRTVRTPTRDVKSWPFTSDILNSVVFRWDSTQPPACLVPMVAFGLEKCKTHRCSKKEIEQFKTSVNGLGSHNSLQDDWNVRFLNSCRQTYYFKMSKVRR